MNAPPDTPAHMSNFDAALKAEAKRVIRNFHSYTSEQRANHASSFRLGYKQRRATGKFFYTHPDVPGLGFDTRRQAALAALR